MKDLLASLFNAKKEIGAIAKDSTNPFFKSQYFDINQLLEHVEPVLAAHNLLVLQPIEDNKVKTIIFHVESGAELNSEIELPNLQDPQKLGSAITYYRRYTLQSLLSLRAEDDDANKATKAVNKADVKITWLTASQLDKVLLKDNDYIKKILSTYNTNEMKMKKEYRAKLEQKLK